MEIVQVQIRFCIHTWVWEVCTPLISRKIEKQERQYIPSIENK